MEDNKPHVFTPLYKLDPSAQDVLDHMWAGSTQAENMSAYMHVLTGPDGKGNEIMGFPS